MIPLAINLVFILGLMAVGKWLEGVGGNDGFWDSFFTPVPMGAWGLVLIGLERSM